MPRHLLVALLLLVPRLVEAQADDPEAVERARRLFGEGVGQHEARQYHEAVETFRAVLAIRAAPAVRYNLALNLFELGEYPEAEAQVQLLLEDPESPEPLRDSARELQTNMAERGGQIRLEVEAPEGAEIVVDGYAVTEPARPVRVIAGTSHQVALVVDGEAVSSEVVSVGVGETQTVRLDEADSAARSPTVDWEGASPVAKDWRFWAALGVVAAVAVVIVVATVLDDDDTGAAGFPLVTWE